MEIWLVVVWCIVSVIIGYLVGSYERKNRPANGTIVVDKLGDVTEVYCSLPVEPDKLTGDEIFTMNVYIATSSQQKQES